MEVFEIPLDQLLPAVWNTNIMDDIMLSKLTESIRRYGIVANLVVRYLAFDLYEVISGNQRLEALKEAGYSKAPCVVVDIDDSQAKLLSQVLNHIQGTDDLGLRAELLRNVMKDISQEEIMAVLPETSFDLMALVSLGSETIAGYLQQKQIAQAARLKHLQFQLAAVQLPVIEEAMSRVLPQLELSGIENPNQRGNALHYLCKYYLEKEKEL